VLKALQLYGDKLFQDIDTLPQELTELHNASLVKISANVKGEHCKKFLVKNIHELSEQTSKTIHSLWVQDYEPAEGMIEKFHVILDKYLKNGMEKIDAYYEVHYTEREKEIVKHSLLNEIKTDLVLSLKIAAMLYRKKRINRILELIDIEKHQKLYNAREMIELELPRKISRDIVSLFDFILDPEEHKKRTEVVTGGNVFNKVYSSDAFSYNSWTKALVMYCSWKNNMEEDVRHIQMFEGEEFIITETKNFVLHTPN
jgi:hypothetical protein